MLRRSLLCAVTPGRSFSAAAAAVDWLCPAQDFSKVVLDQRIDGIRREAEAFGVLTTIAAILKINDWNLYSSGLGLVNTIEVLSGKRLGRTTRQSCSAWSVPFSPRSASSITLSSS